VQRRSAHTNQTVQEHEQSSNTVRRFSACTNQNVQEHEQLANTVRRGIARDEPGMREHETEQRAAARAEPGVREHETEQRAFNILFTFWCLFFTEQYFTLHAFNSTFYFGAYLHLYS